MGHLQEVPPVMTRSQLEHILFDRSEFETLIRTLPETARKTIHHALQVLKLGNAH
jgi:hypothetical protein